MNKVGKKEVFGLSGRISLQMLIFFFSMQIAIKNLLNFLYNMG